MSTTKISEVRNAVHSIEALRARLTGRVFVAGDDRYDAARQTWNAKTFEQHPAIVVMPSVAEDVVAAVRFAREHELAIAVQGGGHGHPHPANDALLVNFASMTRVDVTGRTGRAEGGAKWREVVAAAQPQGLAPLSGFAGTVGVSGYLLGGGLGWLARRYGAAAGSLRAAEVVTADGRLLQVNDRSHAELFWGLCGGGGNFGIVTSMEFELFPVSELFGGFVAYPLARGSEALHAHARWAKTVPDAVTSAVRVMHYPPAPAIPEPLRGGSALVIMACFAGSPAEGEALIKPLRSIGEPLLDTFRAMRYAEVETIANDPAEAPPIFTFAHSGALRDMSTEVIEAVLRIVRDRSSGIFLFEARHAGGALARQPEAAMPFTFRSPWSVSTIATAPMPQALDHGKQTIAALFEALEPALTGEVLINSLEAGNSGPDLTRAAYSDENYRKLVALKNTYDPANVFRFNHNIAPST